VHNGPTDLARQPVRSQARQGGLTCLLVTHLKGVGIAQRNVCTCGQKSRGGWIGFL